MFARSKPTIETSSYVLYKNEQSVELKMFIALMEYAPRYYTHRSQSMYEAQPMKLQNHQDGLQVHSSKD